MGGDDRAGIFIFTSFQNKMIHDAIMRLSFGTNLNRVFLDNYMALKVFLKMKCSFILVMNIMISIF